MDREFIFSNGLTRSFPTGLMAGKTQGQSGHKIRHNGMKDYSPQIEIKQLWTTSFFSDISMSPSYGYWDITT
jgi:hypothetical protein